MARTRPCVRAASGAGSFRCRSEPARRRHFMAGSYLGDVRAMSFQTVPAGWAPCKGQLLPIVQNQALFALLGTAFGGDGHTDFALPSLAGMPAGDGAFLNYCLCVQSSATTPILGEVRAMPFGFAPPGWMPCQGQLLATASN